MSERWKMIHRRFGLWRIGFFPYQGNLGSFQGWFVSSPAFGGKTGTHGDRQAEWRGGKRNLKMQLIGWEQFPPTA